MSDKLYQYAIIFTPERTAEEVARGSQPKSKLLKGIDTILARDEAEVNIRAAREIPEEYLDRLNQIVIATRPF